MWCVWCVCEGCLAVLVVWCGDSAGPPKSKVDNSLAYTKNRLKPTLPSMDYRLLELRSCERDQHVLQPRKLRVDARATMNAHLRARRADTEKDAVINVAASATDMEKIIVAKRRGPG